MSFNVKAVVCAGLTALAAAPVGAAPAPVGARPGAALGFAHPVAPRIIRVDPGVGGRLGRRVPRYGFGNGYLDDAGAGLATTALAQQGFDGAPAAYAPPEPPPLPIQPACPMIIKVGPGLDDPVRTRVIYGSPACY